MFDWFFTLLIPLEYAVAFLMVAFHTALTAVGMPAASGWTWALSIVGLVVVIRILLIPLFVKQIRASRQMQLIQPQMKKIQEKYKGKTDTASRQAMQQETMALYRESGTNPFSSCLPILLQSPIFFALFRVLNGIPQRKTIGPLNATLVEQADQAKLFGAQLSDTFMHANTGATRVLTVVLIILMSLTTFTTQRQLMTKNMPASALDNPFARQQKMLLYVLPVFFAISGINFPIGVLIYWLTTNLWSMGQQFYVIRRMPAPGSEAERALKERQARKRAGGLPVEPGVEPSPGGTATAVASVGGQRQQPKRQKRQRATPRPAAPSSPAKRPGGGTRPGKNR
ncbi:MAG TPA: membrane protein insertase YidC [Kineosporiaceae bacterium]|jgi:YidC/Oxa1 family membrane protein insertase|nr:membrane protein insertase YidC [Kineosporiaceae bacterium]